MPPSRTVRFFGGWAIAAAYAICTYKFGIYPADVAEFEYRSFVFLSYIIMHVILAAAACRIFGKGGDLSPPALVAVVVFACTLFFTFAWYQIFVATDGVKNSTLIYPAVLADASPSAPFYNCTPTIIFLRDYYTRVAKPCFYLARRLTFGV